VLPFGLIVAVWATVVQVGAYPPYLLPSPAKVAEDLYQMTVVDHSLLNNLLDSSIRLAIGYVPGIFGGLAMGVAMGVDGRVAKFTNGPIAFFNAIPALAWVPMAILWFGIGYGAVTFIIFMSVFFPVLFNTFTGIRTIPPQFINVARMCEASRLQVIWLVLIRGALPSIITGVRVGAAYGWRGMVGAEMIAAASGLGYMILNARTYLQTDVVIVGIITIGVCWLAIDRLVLATLERSTVERWGMVSKSV
jgi:NitT/TauT family transport system permease protein/taurine transport system permease protein